MAIKRFSGSWKTRTDILDNITPNNVVQPNVSAPAGEWKPAAWLPIQWQGEASQDYFVISSGKVVGFDQDGRIVPVRFRALGEDGNTTEATVAFAYTTDDVTHGTINIIDGEAVEAADVGNVTVGALSDALMERGYGVGLLPADFAGGAEYKDTTDDDADARTVLTHCFSSAVGICAYDVYAWAGDAPGELNSINYQKQHLVQFLTDIQLKVPVHVGHDAIGGDAEQITVGATAPAAATLWSGAGAGEGVNFPSASRLGAPLRLNAATLNGLSRYTDDVAATASIVGLQLDTQGGRLAANTTRTPIENDGWTREVNAVSKIRQAGDFFVDADVDMVLMFDADGTGIPAAVDASATTYYAFLSTTVAGTTQTAADHRFIHATGNPKAGDFLTYDLQANLLPVAVTAATDMSTVVGRCLAVVEEPKGLLDRVRTAWEGGSFDRTMQMPGSATSGFSDLITLSEEGTSNRIAICNIKIQ